MSLKEKMEIDNKISIEDLMHLQMDPPLRETYYSKRIKFLQKLKEAYKNNWEWITEFVDDFYKLYSSNKDVSYLKDKYKVNIEFDKEKDEPMEFFVDGGYSPGGDYYLLSIGGKLEKAFKNWNPNIRQRVINDAERILVHEYIHKQQNQLKSKDQNWGEDYIENLKECDAFAYSIANEIYKKNRSINPKDLLDIITTDFESLGLHHESENYIRKYKETGGPIYKKFLKTLYEYFDVFFNDDPLKYKQKLGKK